MTSALIHARQIRRNALASGFSLPLLQPHANAFRLMEAVTE